MLYNSDGFLVTYNKLVGLTEEDNNMLEDSTSTKAYFYGRLQYTLELGDITRKQYKLLLHLLEGTQDDIGLYMYESGHKSWWSDFKQESAQWDLKERSPLESFTCSCGNTFEAPISVVDVVLCDECLLKEFLKCFTRLLGYLK